MHLVKYSASGNDFILFHAFIKKDRSSLAKQLCHRQEGIGADGLIILLPHEAYDFEWQFYNADGSEAAMCGNGSRAAAHYAATFGLAPNHMKFLTRAGVIEAVVEGDTVETQLTEPHIIKKNIVEDDKKWWLIDTGVPHLVTLVEDLEQFDKEKAKKLRNIYNANVNYAKIHDSKRMSIRTFERGVEDETLACGTGMAAAFVRAKEEGLVQSHIKMVPKSGEELALRCENKRLFFKGRVKKIFQTFKEEVV